MTFHNLRGTGDLQNNIAVEEKDKIWIPSLMFDNSVEEKHVVNDEFSSMAIHQDTPGIKTVNEYLQENIKYMGFENYLTYFRIYKMDLVCEFEQHNYPFDIQTCSIKVRKVFWVDSNLVRNPN